MLSPSSRGLSLTRHSRSLLDGNPWDGNPLWIIRPAPFFGCSITAFWCDVGVAGLSPSSRGLSLTRHSRGLLDGNSLGLSGLPFFWMLDNSARE